MQSSLRKNIPGRIVASSVLALFVLIVMGLMQTFAGTEKTGASAIYSRGVLRVVIPYRAAQAGAGRLSVEVLDPEDHVIGRMEKATDVVKGAAQLSAEVKPDKPLAVDDLVWHRVRYRFQYDDAKVEKLEGVESISSILRLPVLRILGQQSYLAGSKAAVRVIVSDSNGEVIAGRASVRIDLETQGKAARTLFTGHLNHRDTTEAQFQFPEGLAGNFNLHYTVDTHWGQLNTHKGSGSKTKLGFCSPWTSRCTSPGR